MWLLLVKHRSGSSWYPKSTKRSFSMQWMGPKQCFLASFLQSLDLSDCKTGCFTSTTVQNTYHFPYRFGLKQVCARLPHSSTYTAKRAKMAKNSLFKTPKMASPGTKRIDNVVGTFFSYPGHLFVKTWLFYDKKTLFLPAQTWKWLKIPCFTPTYLYDTPIMLLRHDQEPLTLTWRQRNDCFSRDLLSGVQIVPSKH